ncbi:MAG: M14 family zinc carboxypeptidase [Acidobacteriota bacterium]|nr:M14 family zinc carboxypeptidase [Acidobacteriota bacterium]
MPLQLPIEEVLSTAAAPPVERAQVLGRSRQDRPIHGYRFGSGPLRISLLAGSHADEPVGPELLRRLVSYLDELPITAHPLTAATWYIVPHVNPDGEAANRPWSGELVAAKDHRGEDDQGYDLAAYLEGVSREPPGDDMEWGYPEVSDDGELEDADELRPENLAVTRFLLGAGSPFHLHASLHSMAFAQGPWFLLEPDWVDRTEDMQRQLTERVEAMGYGLHDVDRQGEKGFRRIAPGFSTRPDSRAMAAYFIGRGEAETAALFQPSSMELVRSLGGDPLTLVSEMPLFLVPPPGNEPQPGGSDGPPNPAGGTEPRNRFLAWAQQRLRQLSPQDFRGEAEAYGIRPMPLRDQMRLQLAFLNAGLAAVTADELREQEDGED